MCALTEITETKLDTPFRSPFATAETAAAGHNVRTERLRL